MWEACQLSLLEKSAHKDFYFLSVFYFFISRLERSSLNELNLRLTIEWTECDSDKQLLFMRWWIIEHVALEGKSLDVCIVYWVYLAWARINTKQCNPVSW